MTTGRTQPPRHLKAEGKAAWMTYLAEFDFDECSLIVLQLLCEWIDRREEARAMLKKDGVVIKDRFKQPRPHPANALERNASMMILKHARHLGIDLEPLHEAPGRPAGS